MSNMVTEAAHATLEKLSDIADDARHRVDDLPLHLPHRRRRTTQPMVTIGLAAVVALVGLLVWTMRRTQSSPPATDPVRVPDGEAWTTPGSNAQAAEPPSSRVGSCSITG
jgi:hypothetical protein